MTKMEPGLPPGGVALGYCSATADVLRVLLASAGAVRLSRLAVARAGLFAAGAAVQR
jgi:hypothetical protein